MTQYVIVSVVERCTPSRSSHSSGFDVSRAKLSSNGPFGRMESTAAFSR